MADDAQTNRQRTSADKERSRQQSRSVSGREAARTVGRSTRPQAGPRKGDQGGGNGRGPKAGQRQPQRQGQRQPQRDRAGQRPQRGPGRSQRNRPEVRRLAPARGRSRSGPWIWGSIAVVIVVVVVLVLVNTLGGKPKSNHFTSKPVPASVLSAVTHVSPSVYDAVGTGSGVTITPPKVFSSEPPLTSNGKPVFFYMGGEFCPFCAAERWAMVTALSRFGTFSGLKTMQSASVDVHPNTPTFTFRTATYNSPYVTAKLLEYYGQDNAQGQHPVIGHITKKEAALVTKYDPKTSTSPGGTIPFVDIGNKVIVTGASYTPQLLQGLSRTQIAANLSTAKNPVTQAIIGTANYLTAGICASAGSHAPSSVCSSAGVQAAAKALGLSLSG